MVGQFVKMTVDNLCKIAKVVLNDGRNNRVLFTISMCRSQRPIVVNKMVKMAFCHSQNGEWLWNIHSSNSLKILHFAQKLFYEPKGF